MSSRHRSKREDPPYYEKIHRTEEVITRHPYDRDADYVKPRRMSPRKSGDDTRSPHARRGGKHHASNGAQRPNAPQRPTSPRRSEQQQQQAERPSRASNGNGHNGYQAPYARQAAAAPPPPPPMISYVDPYDQPSVQRVAPPANYNSRSDYEQPPLRGENPYNSQRGSLVEVSGPYGAQAAPPRPSANGRLSLDPSALRGRSGSFMADDYISPRRNDAGKFSYMQPPRRSTVFAGEQSRGPIAGSFRVRIHRAEGVFAEMEDSSAYRAVLPSTYVAVHTTEERGHSGVVDEDLNPIFNDEFIFHSSDVAHDALVCTLVALVPHGSRDKKVSECVISLKNLQWGVEREVWVPMVRHPGTPYAYECGELLVSIFSEDYGVEELPTEEEETLFSEEVQRLLLKHAPEQLHFLDWLVGEYLPQGDLGLARLRDKLQRRPASPTPTRGSAPRSASNALVPYSTTPNSSASRSRASQPQPVKAPRPSAEAPKAITDYPPVPPPTTNPTKLKLTVLDVVGLITADGRPISAESCYVTLVPGVDGEEQKSRTVAYQRRAIFNQDFRLVLPNPDEDTVRLTVYAGGRKCAEVDVALANVKAGVTKDVSLMLVRAAETGDASNGGTINLALKTDTFTSLCQMSAEQEKEVRARVLAYLWCYLRDELHRLDYIVAGVEDLATYMKEWTRSIGPERPARHLTVNVRHCANVFPSSAPGLPSRCYVRVAAGPAISRTELAAVRNNSMTFNSPIDVTIYDPETDSIELMVVQEWETKEAEVSRVVLGVSDLARREPSVKCVHLIADAGTRAAKVQGELTVELVAEDFGDRRRTKGEPAEPFNTFVSRQEASVARAAPEELHRVPFLYGRDDVPTKRTTAGGAASAERGGASVSQSREYSKEIQAAPMTVKVLGLKNFAPGCDCYVKVYLDDQPILRTKNYSKGGTECTFNIDDDNEVTTRLSDATSAKLTCKVACGRAGKSGHVYGWTEVALGSLVQGEHNVLWVPIVNAKKSSASKKAKKQKSPAGTAADTSAAVPASTGETSVVVKERDMLSNIKHNRMSTGGAVATSPTRGADLVGGINNNANSTIISQANPNDVSLGVDSDLSGPTVGLLGLDLQSMAFPVTTVVTVYRKSTTGPRGEKKTEVVRPESVTKDVTTLLAKYKPADLGKVQPLIAQCTSLKDAHHELRAKVANRPVEATVYLTIDTVDMNTTEGRQQEEQRSIAVEASYGNDRQMARRKASGRNGSYEEVRLDLCPPKDDEKTPLVLRLRGVYPNAPGASTQLQTTSPKRQTSPTKGRRSSLPMGGKNNLASYMDTSNVDFSAVKAPGDPPVNAGLSAPLALPGEIGEVHLSLRALLTDPVHKVGDRISVPIIASAGGSGSRKKRLSAEEKKKLIVGQVTFHLSLPAFEQLPEWLRLAPRRVLQELEPDYVHYYERRIGAFLREYNPSDLVHLHYNIYERDVATGRWYLSLKDWLNALVKRYGAEKRSFGPEPPLPFDPEAREYERQQRQSIYAEDTQHIFESSDDEEEPGAGPSSQKNGRHDTTSLDEQQRNGQHGSSSGLKRQPKGSRSSRRAAQEAKAAEPQADYSF